MAIIYYAYLVLLSYFEESGIMCSSQYVNSEWHDVNGSFHWIKMYYIHLYHYPKHAIYIYIYINNLERYNIIVYDKIWQYPNKVLEIYIS